MESFNDSRIMHWDHEPAENMGRTPVNNRRYSRLPIGATSERFMESLLSQWRVHWDHEPEGSQISDLRFQRKRKRKRKSKRTNLNGSWRAFFRSGACIGTVNRRA